MPTCLQQAKTFCRNYTKVRGATVRGTIPQMPAAPTHTVVTFDPQPIWEGNNYFDSTKPTRVTVPNRRAGRYFIHAELQWEPVAANTTFTDGHSREGFFGAYLVRNGLTAPSKREAQSIASVVGGSTMVSQIVMLETRLGDNDFLELYVFQRVPQDPTAGLLTIMVNVELTVRRLGKSA